MTLSQAKNAMRRAISDLIDQPLTKKEKQQVWDYFNSCCAFCGKAIERVSRHGHIDHLVCRSNGGCNSLGNCVLACKECNGNEKRDQLWTDFLKLKSPDKRTFAIRLRRINSWRAQSPPRNCGPLSREAEVARSKTEAAIALFEKNFKELRERIQ